MKYDEKDITIIRMLQRNARTSFADIAEKCDISLDTVIKRFKKLQKGGVIKGTTLILNPKSLGFGCLASLELDAEPAAAPKIIDHMKGMEQITFCTPTMGTHNIFAVAIQKSVEELNALKEYLKNMADVKDVKASIWMEDTLLCPENFEFKALLER